MWSDDNSRGRILRPQTVNIRAYLAGCDRPRLTIQRDLVILAQFDQDVATLLHVFGWRGIASVTTGRVNRSFGQESGRYHKEDQQDKDHVQHGREVNVAIFVFSFATEFSHYQLPLQVILSSNYLFLLAS